MSDIERTIWTATEVPGDEEQLRCRALDGDTRAFDVLVARYAGLVYRIALRMTNHADDALDIQQETFLRAYRHLGRFRGESSFRTWLSAITARVCLTYRTRRRMQSTVALPEEHDDVLVVTDPSVELVTDYEAARVVQRTLARLHPPERLVLVLKHIEGFNHEEIARMLHCSPEASRVRLHRAMQRFREIFRQENVP